MLKSIIRHRRNSLFFKTQIGANVSDNLTSILFTAKVNGLNSVEYLKNLLIHQTLWKESPQEWLPWNYLDTINKLQNPAPTSN
jgi:transposase